MNYCCEAFLNGYAMYEGAPLLTRSRIALKAIDAMPDTLESLGFAEAAGEKEGLYAKVYKRRDRLWMKYDTAVRRWSKKLSMTVSPDDLGTEITRALGTAPRKTEDEREAVKAAVLSYFQKMLDEHPKLAREIITLTTEAKAEATAEGKAAGEAMVAQVKKEKVPDFPTRVAAHVKDEEASKEYGKRASTDAHLLMVGLAGDAAIAVVANQNGDHGTTATDAVSAGDGAAFYMDQSSHSYWALGLLAIYALTQGTQGLYDYLDMEDGRVCPICEGYAEGGPYTAAEVPVPPVHGGCRCWIVPTE